MNTATQPAFVAGSLPNQPAARANTLHASQVRALLASTPKILLIWSQRNSSFLAMATPDTGTTLTIMSSSYIHKLFTV